MQDRPALVIEGNEMSKASRVEEVGATFEALRAHGPTKGPTVSAGVVYAAVGLVSLLGYAPREFQPVPVAELVRYLNTTREVLIRGWREAELAGILERESRKEPGKPRRGHIRFTEQFLAEIDRIIKEEER